MGAPLIGARIERKEDYRFLTGAGQYTDDVDLPRQSHAAFVRSPHAHAVIKKISLGKGKSRSGVLAIYTGEDFAAAKLGGLPCGWLITDVNGQPMKEPPHPCLAQGKVRYVGDQVAIVIAETQSQARDAAELVEVDYQVLPAVIDGAKARAKGAPQLHDIAPDNTCYVWAIGDKGVCDAAFAKAAHVTKLEFINNRLIPNAIEPRVRDRLLLARRRQLHAVRRQPEPARRAAADDRVRDGPARAQGARGGGRRRRRLRLEDLPVRRGRRGDLGREADQPAR